MKPIPDYPHYFIIKDGQIWSKQKHYGKGGWLKPFNKDGYCRICLYKEGKHCQRPIHSLVLETYIGPCPEGMECRHLNGRRDDNRLENLKWGTKSENSRDAISQGTHVSQVREYTLTPFLARMIRNWYATKLITQVELGKLFDVRPRHIRKIIKGERWKEA